MSNKEVGELMSPWAYIGYGILFMIPLVGLICCIVFSFNNDQPNRRNYSRSVLIGYIIGVVVVLIATSVMGVSLNSLLSYR